MGKSICLACEGAPQHLNNPCAVCGTKQPDMSAEPVAWIRKNGFRFIAEIEPQDDSEVPLYTSPVTAPVGAEPRRIGKIVLDKNKHPRAVLETGYDDQGNQWDDGTPIYAAPQPPEPVRKTDWNNELSSWSDEDFIRIFHERPDLADRLRKVLPEPVAWKDSVEDIHYVTESFNHNHTSQIPEGYKLVPIEPTEEMINAATQDGISVDGKPVWKHNVAFQAKWRYQAMLEAAPEVKVDGEPVKVSDDLAHEIWAAAQTAPGEGIEDAVERVASLLAQQDADKVDAERYRYARDNIMEDHELPGGYYLSDEGEYWDKTIDAARKEQA